jgi:hypothetical protein
MQVTISVVVLAHNPCHILIWLTLVDAFRTFVCGQGAHGNNFLFNMEEVV